VPLGTYGVEWDQTGEENHRPSRLLLARLATERAIRLGCVLVNGLGEATDLLNVGRTHGRASELCCVFATRETASASSDQ